MRVAVLLGAGASVDAGLPLTVELAEMIVARANEQHGLYGSRPPNWVRALNFVYGAMVGYQAEDGSNPLQAVNIERLISALRLLQSATDHEVAPFVAAWKAGALGIPELDQTLGAQVIDAISRGLGSRGSFAERDVADRIASIAKAATGTGNTQAFAEAEGNILFYLGEILGKPNTVEYLYPIAELAQTQPGGLDVVTLNYDLTIERMSYETATELDRGIERWTPGAPLIFKGRDKTINLFKLHGSLDWEFEPTSESGAKPPSIAITTEPDFNDRHKRPWLRRRPWIVVGEREKLSTDGPMLTLMRAAEDALQNATHIVVIGYSFSDAHINSMVRDWMLGDSKRTIGIVDVTWRPPNGTGFRDALVEKHGASPQHSKASRFIAIEGTARETLSVALTSSPMPDPENYVVIEEARRIGHDRLRIALALKGPDLYHLSVLLQEEGVDTPSQGDVDIDTFTSEPELRSLWVESGASAFAAHSNL